jgi:outer membrane lipoprotein LolB
MAYNAIPKIMYILRMQSKFVPLFLLLALVVMLSACGSMPTEPELPQISQDEIDQLLEQRQSELQAISRWQLDARFSFVTESEAWSGKLHWQQQPNNEYFIQFSDPAGQGAMQLQGGGQMVELRLADGKTYQAEDADTLLRQETDWNLPIKSLWYWIRGLPDPGLPLKSELDAQGLPGKFDQQGWRIIYQSYHQVDNRSFPRKIVIEKAALKLKLIIMNWIVE